MKVLIWLGLALLVLLALRKKVRTGMMPPSGGAGRNAPAGHVNQPVESGESMVCCAHCAIYVPVSESVSRDGKSYCCKAHAEQSA